MFEVRSDLRDTRDSASAAALMERRYRLALKHVAIPSLSVEQIALLRHRLVRDGSDLSGHPRDALVKRCKDSAWELIYEWEWEESYSCDFPGLYPPRNRPDTSLFDQFAQQIRGWTTLECLKVINFFADIGSISCKVIDLTPEVIHAILEGAKAARGGEVEQWRAATSGGGSLCPALAPE